MKQREKIERGLRLGKGTVAGVLGGQNGAKDLVKGMWGSIGRGVGVRGLGWRSGAEVWGSGLESGSAARRSRV